MYLVPCILATIRFPHTARFSKIVQTGVLVWVGTITGLDWTTGLTQTAKYTSFRAPEVKPIKYARDL